MREHCTPWSAFRSVLWKLWNFFVSRHIEYQSWCILTSGLALYSVFGPPILWQLQILLFVDATWD